MNTADVIETETFLLATLISGSEKAYYETATLVDPQDFDSPAHRAIYRAIGRVAERAHPDWLLVWQALGEDAGLVDEKGGRAYLASLSSLPVVKASRKAYAEALRQASDQRRLRSRLEQALEDPNLTMSQLADDLYRLERHSIDGVTLHDAVSRLKSEAEAPPRSTIEYPWPPIQSLTHGLKPGWLCYLAGETSHGKTAAALELADSVAVKGGRVLYVSLEMPAVDMALRMAQRRGASGGRIQHGKANDEDMAVMGDLLNQEWTTRLHLEFADRVDRLPGLVLRYKPDLIVVDYMGLLDIGRDSRLEGTTKNSRALKMLALRANVPVVCLVQLSRANENDRNKLPGLYRLRDSGQLENDADQVVFIWRKRDENQRLTPEGALAVAKARNGETGTTRMVFDGQRQTLTVSFM